MQGWRTVAFVVASPAVSRIDGRFGTGLNKQSPYSEALLRLRVGQRFSHNLRAADGSEPKARSPPGRCVLPASGLLLAQWNIKRCWNPPFCLDTGTVLHKNK